MANYITEDDIEVSLINILKSDELAYNFIQCDSNPNKKEDLNDGTCRISKKQCVSRSKVKMKSLTARILKNVEFLLNTLPEVFVKKNT